MSAKSKREYLTAIWGRYHRVGRRFKTRILNEFCEVCGYARKYAIGLLNRRPGKPRRRRGPRRKYDRAVLEPLKVLWLASEQMCSKRLQAALPTWLPFYEQEQGALPAAVWQKLLRISPASIDRLLRPVRARYPGKGLSGTRSGRLLREHIPIRTDHRDIDRPGYLEADTVAHCGTSMAGSFVWSATFTDLVSQWTENRAVWNKGAEEIVREVRWLEAELPFEILGFDVDNGSEFLSFHLWRYFLQRPKPVPLTRSRPYRKNDQAHVEQKNWTHVRQLLGYQRLERRELIPLINDLYRTWGQWHNFFCPTLKLMSKTRQGSRIRRKYSQPQTPYQRLLASPHLSTAQKDKLRAQYEQLNPLRLKDQIEQKLKVVFNAANAR